MAGRLYVARRYAVRRGRATVRERAALGPADLHCWTALCAVVVCSQASVHGETALCGGTAV